MQQLNWGLNDKMLISKWNYDTINYESKYNHETNEPYTTQESDHYATKSGKKLNLIDTNSS